MLDPQALYQLSGDQPDVAEIGEPVLLFALSGFIDGGHASRLAVDHLLSTLGHRLLATFDLDQIYDYRARRPMMTFEGDHWSSYDMPTLQLHLARDLKDRPFLLLAGPEPDVQWERFAAAVTALVAHYRVRLSIGLHAIPMAVPHTRPVGVTAHALPPELVTGYKQWIGKVQVPGHVVSLLEYRLGTAGHPAAGFAVHVPHYLAQNEYPAAAQVLLESVGRLAGLNLPTQALATAGAQVQLMITEQLVDQPEILAVVRSLEEQYDAIVQADELGAVPAELPSADELGAELERYLAAENERNRWGEA